MQVRRSHTAGHISHGALVFLGRFASRNKGSGSYSAAEAAAVAPCVCLDGLPACRLQCPGGAAANNIHRPCTGGVMPIPRIANALCVSFVAPFEQHPSALYRRCGAPSSYSKCNMRLLCSALGTLIALTYRVSLQRHICLDCINSKQPV